jgi:hypothetical protein
LNSVEFRSPLTLKPAVIDRRYSGQLFGCGHNPVVKQFNMFRKTVTGFCLVWIACVGLSLPLKAQNAAPGTENPAAVTKFFEQLRRIFGRFSQADLQQVFLAAEPIRCTELVEGKGEWKPVAFFNDNRELGAWYHQSLEEVKTDLRVYAFKGVCTGLRTAVQLTTKFPVAESVKSYNNHEIRLQEIEVNVNPAVDAVFDFQSQSYAFDLPYMFLREHRDGELLYTLTPQTINDRESYEPDVIDHWDCKSVREDDVTYQFLICHATLARVSSLRRDVRRVPYGAAGYLILSDGKEGRASVRYSFGDSSKPPDGGKPAPRPLP